jgi:hypothetical protein
MRAISILAAAGVLLAALPASAQNAAPVKRIGIETFAGLLKDKGYKAEVVRKEGSANPFIRTGMNGRRVAVYFYECKEESCGSYQFRAYYDADAKFTPVVANNWNRDKRFGKAYLDKDKDYNLEWDVDLDGGVTSDYIKATFQRYETVLAEFEKSFP